MTAIESSWFQGMAAVTTSMLATLLVLAACASVPSTTDTLPLSLLCRSTQTLPTQSTLPPRVLCSSPPQTSGRCRWGVAVGRFSCQHQPSLQMVWEQRVAVVVMLTALTDMGLVSIATHFLCINHDISPFLWQSQSCQYWPGGGVTSYGDYEVSGRCGLRCRSCCWCYC